MLIKGSAIKIRNDRKAGTQQLQKGMSPKGLLQIKSTTKALWQS